MLDEMRNCPPGYRPAVRALAWALMVRLHRLAPPAGQAAPPQPPSAAIERVAPALEYLAEHHDRTVTVGGLARLCHTSETNFRRLFRSAVGRSPREYLVDLRIHMAAALLQETRRSVLDISLAVGYQTLSSFNRHFKARVGKPPRAWRSAAQGRGPAELPDAREG